MADTNLEKIKKFNETKRLQHEETAKRNPDDSLSTNAEHIKLQNEKVRLQNEALANRSAKQKKEDAEKEQAEIEAERLDAVKHITDATSTLIDNVNDTVNPIKDWIASQPTPGGIAALVVFILFFALAVIPVNSQGQTRLYLIWQTILGRTHMLYNETMGYGNPNFGAGAGGTFGTTSSADTVTAQTSTITPGSVQNGNLTPIDISHLNLFGTL